MEENINNIKKNKLNKTWLLVAGLVILTVILLVVSLTSKNFSPLKSTQKDVMVDFAHTTLSISEDIRPSATSGKYEVDVLIDTGEDEISGAQIELSYDPTMLTNVDIVPGSFIESPSIPLKTIDPKNGVIRYPIAIGQGDKAVKGSGVIAVISFTKIGSEETTLNFLPQSQVISPKQTISVLKETISGVINVSGASNSGTQPTISN